MSRQKSRAQTPGRRALKVQLDHLLRYAAGLDRLEEGVGDRLCQEAATALNATRRNAIRNSESETNSEPATRAY